MGLFTDPLLLLRVLLLGLRCAPAQRMSTDLSQTGREMHLCKSERSVGEKTKQTAKKSV